MHKFLLPHSIFYWFLRTASKNFLHRWRCWTAQHFRRLCNFFSAVSWSLFYKWRSSCWMFSWVAFLYELIHRLFKRSSVVIGLFSHRVFHRLILWLIFVFVGFYNPLINKAFILLYTFLFILWNVQINLFDILNMIRLVELANVWMVKNLLCFQSFMRIEMNRFQNKVDSFLINLRSEKLWQSLLAYLPNRFKHTVSKRRLDGLNIVLWWLSCKRNNSLELV